MGFSDGGFQLPSPKAEAATTSSIRLALFGAGTHATGCPVVPEYCTGAFAFFDRYALKF
jgi:hypothetical protein